mmetsp:Transcript_73607/g.130271  ORF Transcript_73607/g.130271 Transcript_73607/m.130271 type:complete len:91 (-) Transcript_73607:478-750(-)
MQQLSWVLLRVAEAVDPVEQVAEAVDLVEQVAEVAEAVDRVEQVAEVVEAVVRHLLLRDNVLDYKRNNSFGGGQLFLPGYSYVEPDRSCS